VIHHLTGTPDAVGRELLERGLSRVRRLADAPIRVTVVYDSAAEVSRHQRSGLEIRFVPDADEDVRAVAAAAGGTVVVVSSDRAVRDGVEGRPVIGLWSEAMAGWISRRR
jgi:predicted nuclease with RNAse H fold